MLPSTGYFKGINCPFYDTGLCERPYCHFRHSKREPSLEACGESIDNGEILQQLVSEAVRKVLLHKDGNQSSIESSIPSQSIISKVVKELNPSATSGSATAATKVTYNPTPISELNKLLPNEVDNITQVSTPKEIHNRKHIPVPYTPHRPTRVHVNRTNPSSASDLSGHSTFNKNAIAMLNAASPAEHNKYTPMGSSSDSNAVYLPGSAAYKTSLPYSPANYNTDSLTKDTASTKSANYVPTDIGSIQSVSNMPTYTPLGQSSSGATYYPGTKATAGYSTSSYCPQSTYSTSRPGSESPCYSTLHYKPTPLLQPQFSSDEDDEPTIKKPKLNDELKGLEDLEPEFEILGQILDDENSSTNNTIKDTISSNIKNKIKDKKPDKSKSKASDDKRRSSDSKSNRSSHSTTKHDSEKLKTGKGDQDKVKIQHKSDHKKTESSSKHDSKYKHHSSKSKDNGRSISKDKEKHSSSSKSLSGTSSSKSAHSRHSSKSSASKSKSEHDSKSSLKNSDSKSKSVSKHSSDRSKHRESKSKKFESSDTSEKKGHKSHSGKSTREPLKSKEKIPDGCMVVSDESSSNENELIEEFSDSDEDTIAQECLKIFEEYIPSTKESVHQQHTVPSKEPLETSQVGSKKRVAHTTNQTIYRSTHKALPDHKANALQTMSERHSKVKEYHKSRGTTISKVETSNSQNHLPTKKEEALNKSKNELSIRIKDEPSRSANSSSKVRIAHVPNVSTLLTAKKALPKAPEPKSTPTQTVSKGTSRVAHIPNDVYAERPGVLEPLATKIPINIRARYLHLMMDECLKIYLVAEDAYSRAQEEELSTNKKCTAIPIYKNSAVLTITRLRKELQEANGVKKSNSKGTVSHSKILAGKIGEKVSWSIENKYKKDNEFSEEFKGNKFYENISKWILSEQELQDNGFPRLHPDIKDKGIAKIFTKNTRQKPQKGNMRWCCRCKKEYAVDKKGIAVVTEECIYHPNNKYRFRGEVKYQCCGQDGTSDGCLSASCHVYEYVDHDKLRGFVKTLPKDDESNDANHSVYALDCEMCYTTHGLDLTRVTVIDTSCKVVFESLVKPLYPIIDYNTRYSGLTEEHMCNVTTTLLEVQATFLHMFSDKTILVGHSLESDFKALKLIHDTVVDTSVIFPHKMGPPYKRALRNLSSEYLKKIIQNSVDGHDSAEDATVCMELLIWKLKEELKLR